MMAKVLIVDASQESRAALGQALLEAGYDVVSAGGGGEALGMLEWEQPELIVSGARFDDMDGFQLLGRVRAEPAAAGAVFVLLAGHNRPIALAAAEAGADMTITGEFTLSSVVSRIGDLLAQRGSEDSRPLLAGFGTGQPRSTEPLWAALDQAAPAGSAAPDSAGFAGSLSAMDLTELLQMLSIGGKTGHLAVALLAGEAVVVLDAGRVVHVGYRGLTGEGAFAALVAAAQRESDARFRFNRTERHELERFPRTMSRSAEQLLLSIAVGIDERTGEPSPLSSEGGPHSHRLGG
jgi:CheY-like chemotaxis protein